MQPHRTGRAADQAGRKIDAQGGIAGPDKQIPPIDAQTAVPALKTVKPRIRAFPVHAIHPRSVIAPPIILGQHTNNIKKLQVK